MILCRVSVDELCLSVCLFVCVSVDELCIVCVCLFVCVSVDELLVTLLDSSRHELVFASCGVLVNLTSDPQLRASLSSSGGVGK